MLAAYIWHWWLGLVLTVSAVLVIPGLIFGYLRKVTAPQYRLKQKR